VLKALELKDFAIVDALRVEFSPGLNVLTGETGAGKSILIDALALLIGGRADLGMVRAGAQGALIQGFFSSGELESATRRLQASGRSSARLDGEVVTVSELAERGGSLVAIHGQHASQTLLEAAEQRRLLDRVLDKGTQATLARYREGYGRYRGLQEEVGRLKDAWRERARRLDMLDFQIAEIDAARLRAGEEEELRGELQTLRHAERIVSGAGAAVTLLCEGEASAEASAVASAVDKVAQAQRQLELAGRYNPHLNTLAAELQEAMTGLQAIAGEVADFLADFEADPHRLETLEARQALLERLKLKYGESIAAVLAFRQVAGDERGELTGTEERVGELEAELAALEERLSAEAAALSAARGRAADRIGKQVTEEIRGLGMPNARFEVVLSPLGALGPHGKDRVTFLFSANLGEPPAPLAAVASGGELSRVMLGLNVVTGSDVATLAFDEVDAGLGGGMGRAVGATLKALARDRQILVVTHLPQVAAFADCQFLVTKLEQDGRTVTRVERLERERREEELARMLSGAVTETARAHARELLEDARKVKV
jgi:DNA repair protein RecN (Recombination protein N)